MKTGTVKRFKLLPNAIVAHTSSERDRKWWYCDSCIVKILPNAVCSSPPGPGMTSTARTDHITCPDMYISLAFVSNDTAAFVCQVCGALYQYELADLLLSTFPPFIGKTETKTEKGCCTWDRFKEPCNHLNRSTVKTPSSHDGWSIWTEVSSVQQNMRPLNAHCLLGPDPNVMRLFMVHPSWM